MASSDRSADFAPLEGSTTALLTTFRRGGEAVGTPLSIVVTGGKAYFVTAGDSGKAKRLAHTDRVTLAPCTLTGKVIPVHCRLATLSRPWRGGRLNWKPSAVTALFWAASLPASSGTIGRPKI